MDMSNSRDAPGGGALAQAIVHAGDADYAWTHSTPVEGFFAVLTVVIVPVAILRWARRLRSLRFIAGGRSRRNATS